MCKLFNFDAKQCLVSIALDLFESFWRCSVLDEDTDRPCFDIAEAHLLSVQAIPLRPGLYLTRKM